MKPIVVKNNNLKDAWKNNRERMLEGCRKGGRKTNGKSLKNAWKTNRKLMLELASIAGKIANGQGLKKAWENDREKMLKLSSKAAKLGGITLKKAWENDREGMIEICSRGGKNLWKKHDREIILRGCRKGGQIGGKISGGKILKKLWKNNRERMLENSSKAGKIGGKINGSGKIFKRLWKNDRKKMLEGCRKAGKISFQKQQKTKPSYIELIVQSFLAKLKIKYRNNVWFKYNGRHKEADIVIPKYNLIIECDGWMHDKDEKIKQNDKFKTKMFNSLGYKVLRLTGREIRNGSYIGKFLRKINRIESRKKLYGFGK